MYEQFLEKLKNKEPFSFVRYGDGEATAMFQTRPETHGNVDGHLFYKDMGEALKNIILSRPKYYLGMQRFAREETHAKEWDNFIHDNNLQDIEWVNADVWHHASIHNEFDKFFKALEDRVVLLVGPEYLRPVVANEIGPFGHHIQISPQNCWLEKDNIVQKIKTFLSAYNYVTNVVVLFCASMPTKVMIDEIYNDGGEFHTLIDVGSVFDPYVNKASRGYHKKIIARMKEEEHTKNQIE